MTTRDSKEEAARERMVEAAEKATEATDANHAARGRLMKQVLIPFADWLDAELAAERLQPSELLQIMMTGFASSVGLSIATMGGVNREDIEGVAADCAEGFFMELADALLRADGKMPDPNRSIN